MLFRGWSDREERNVRFIPTTGYITSVILSRSIQGSSALVGNRIKGNVSTPNRSRSLLTPIYVFSQEPVRCHFTFALRQNQDFTFLTRTQFGKLMVWLTFISTSPRHSNSKLPNVSRTSFVAGLTWIFNGSPLDSILDAVFTVSPNKQYLKIYIWGKAIGNILFIHLGILRPTTPATQGPVCIPIRSLSGSSGRWRILNCFTWLSNARDILAISAACLLPFLSGRPDTTI